MNKPKKKNVMKFAPLDNYPCGFNQACEEWEKYCKHLEDHAERNRIKAGEQYQEKWDIINSLPNVEEIGDIVLEKHKEWEDNYCKDSYWVFMAKAIFKRIYAFKLKINGEK